MQLHVLGLLAARPPRRPSFLSLGLLHDRVGQIVTRTRAVSVRPKQEPQPSRSYGAWMVLTCGIDGARQARVQQPQQLGAPTVDATECGC